MHTLPDYLQPGLRLVFVGFNPSMRSAAVGHYYAGPGNLFWPLLSEAGLLPEPLTYAQDHRILQFGIGLTDLVKRPTPSSADLSSAEARAGVLQLQTKLVTHAPRVVCAMVEARLRGDPVKSRKTRPRTEAYPSTLCIKGRFSMARSPYFVAKPRTSGRAFSRIPIRRSNSGRE